MTPLASIVITTRNRRTDLERAVLSAVAQGTESEIEIIVIDDASTDDTAEMITARFPQVRLHRSEQSLGLIVQRNRAARLARAPIIFSIDDDACFSTPGIVTEILEQFQSPAVGAVAIPFIDITTHPGTTRQVAPIEDKMFITSSFIGTAHALRRDIFLGLGGYRESLFHQGEEGDYCLRMLAAGHVVRLGRSNPIHHFESPRRDFRRVDVYGRRNNVLFGWHYAPAHLLPGYLAMTTLNGIRHGLRVGRTGTMIAGLGRGYGAILQEPRSPVSSGIFNLYRELVDRGTVPLSEIAFRLPPLIPVGDYRDDCMPSSACPSTGNQALPKTPYPK